MIIFFFILLAIQSLTWSVCVWRRRRGERRENFSPNITKRRGRIDLTHSTVGWRRKEKEGKEWQSEKERRTVGMDGWQEMRKREKRKGGRKEWHEKEERKRRREWMNLDSDDHLPKTPLNSFSSFWVSEVKKRDSGKRRRNKNDDPRGRRRRMKERVNSMKNYHWPLWHSFPSEEKRGRTAEEEGRNWMEKWRWTRTWRKTERTERVEFLRPFYFCFTWVAFFTASDLPFSLFLFYTLSCIFFFRTDTWVVVWSSQVLLWTWYC